MDQADRVQIEAIAAFGAGEQQFAGRSNRGLRLAQRLGQRADCPAKQVRVGTAGPAGGL